MESKVDNEKIKLLKTIVETYQKLGINVTNGGLREISQNEELMAELSDEQKKFIDDCNEQQTERAKRGLRANREQRKAVEEAERIRLELIEQKEIAEAATQDALESKRLVEADRDAIATELEQTEGYKLTANRQEFQHKFAKWIAVPVFMLIGFLAVSTLILSIYERDIAQTWLTILASVSSSTVASLISVVAAVYALERNQEVKPEKGKSE